MEWFSTCHIDGIIIGICTFLIIGFFHPIVIKAEYYSSLLGVFAFSSFWTIKEIFDQRKRVLKGWFPMNPKRRQEYLEN